MTPPLDVVKRRLPSNLPEIFVFTCGLHSNSLFILGLPYYRILNINHKKELPWSLWAGIQAGRVKVGFSV